MGGVRVAVQKKTKSEKKREWGEREGDRVGEREREEIESEKVRRRESGKERR